MTGAFGACIVCIEVSQCTLLERRLLHKWKGGTRGTCATFLPCEGLSITSEHLSHGRERFSFCKDDKTGKGWGFASGALLFFLRPHCSMYYIICKGLRPLCTDRYRAHFESFRDRLMLLFAQLEAISSVRNDTF